MTLWGHSAGSVAVDYYNFAFPTTPLVSGLIMDSGTAHLDQLVSPDTTHSNFTFVASKVGCGNQTSADAELECMRKVPASVIEDFVHEYEDSGVTPSITFAPVVDEKIVFGDYSERAALGAQSSLPAIIGMDANEGMFLAPYNASGADQAVADSISYAYFWCPATKTSIERSASPQNLTTYRFLYSGDFLNVSPESWMGAYHSSELPLIFGTHDLNGKSTDFEVAVSEGMQDAYLAFAKGQDLSGEGVGWGKYEGKKGNVRVWAGDRMRVSKEMVLEDIEDECEALGLL